jgi:hypothetical protein
VALGNGLLIRRLGAWMGRQLTSWALGGHRRCSHDDNMSIDKVRTDGLLQLVGLWIAAGIVFAFLEGPLIAVMGPFLILPLGAGYVCAGAGLLLAGIMRLRRANARRAAFASLALVLTWLGAGWSGGWHQLSRAGDALEFHLRFQRLEPRYSALVPELLVQAPETHGYQQRNGVTYVLDAGPPKRLAFLQPGGILDNWEGIVYDPTGAVSAARGWQYDGATQQFTAPPAVRGLFGGDIVACNHVRGPWYRCWFT